MPPRAKVTAVLSALRKRYGPVPLPEPRQPFALIVWENAAYLVPDEVRARVFAALEREIGLEPAGLLAAGSPRIVQALREGGMQPQHRAQKVLRCAEIAIALAGGDLAQTLAALPVAKARAMLKHFPGIAEPGADKVLLLCGYARIPALESNGLRVLQRLGFVPADPSYARAYKCATAVLAQMDADFVEAFALLRAHGRELCKRTNPVCAACTVRKDCPSANR